MKNNLFTLLFLLTVKFLFAQKSANFYTGFNLSMFKQKGILTETQSDSSASYHSSLLLPNIGFEETFVLNKKCTFIAGMGLHFTGVRNFRKTLNDGVFNDSKFRVGYFRIPIQLEYHLNPSFSFIGGYAFNYIFRKNQNFITLENPNDINSKLVSTFKPYHHNAQLGIAYYLNKYLSIKGIVNVGLTPIVKSEYATANIITTNSLQLSICYHIYNPIQLERQTGKKRKKTK